MDSKDYQNNKTYFQIILLLGISVGILNITVSAANSLIPFFITLSWTFFALLGLLLPAYGKIFLTAFFIFISFALFVVMKLSGIVMMPLLCIAAVFAHAMLPSRQGIFFSIIFNLSALTFFIWRPEDITPLWWRIFVTNMVISVFVYLVLNRLRISNENLQTALNEAEKANQIKTNFLSNISHELRTPLNGMYGSLQIIELHHSNSEKVKKFARTGQDAFKFVDDLINNLLDINKLSEGKVVLNPEANVLARVLTSTNEYFQDKANEKGISLTHQLDGLNNEEKRMFDQDRLIQILNNLLSNAIKNTENGSVTLHVSSGDGDNVVFSVEDTGVGIPADKLGEIFVIFEQVKPSRLSNERGSGLGLFIVKRLVSMMNGKIEVKSKEGKGTTFTVTLPLPRADEV